MAKTVRKKKKSRAYKRTRFVFWTVFILFITPFVILGYILLSAAGDTGKPILGNRYEGDLNPAIAEDQLKQISASVKGISGVEDTYCNLAAGTLRIYADISDDASSDTASSIASSIYDDVSSVLDPSVYFSQHDDMKMYDLEIHVYTQNSDADADNFVYVIETKTSSMDAPVTQLVSEPIDAALAEELRQKVEERNNPAPSASSAGDMNVSAGETEDTPSPDTAE